MTVRPDILTFNETLELAEAAFDQAHPRASLPDWFNTSVFKAMDFTDAGRLEVRYWAQPAMQLGENYSWIETEDGEILQYIDPATDVKSYVIGMTPKEAPIILFKVAVDPVTAEVQVLDDLDISSLRTEDIEHPRPSKGIPTLFELVGRWTVTPTTEQADKVRALVPALRHTMPSRLIHYANNNTQLALGQFRPREADALELALTPLGFEIERKVLNQR